ncbi:MAG TPA: sensor histidine kinase, partial [Actinomycetota bacterium]
MRLRRWIERIPARPWVADGLLALAVATVNFVVSGASNSVGPVGSLWRPLDALGWVLLVAGPLALVARRRWPLAVLAV